MTRNSGLRPWVRHSSYCYASEGRGGAPRLCICGLDDALAAQVTPQESADPREAVVAALRALDEWLLHPDRSYTPHELAMEAHRRVVDIRAALAAAPLPSGTPDPDPIPAPLPFHPDDGHGHSFGCRRCGVDAPPVGEAAPADHCGDPSPHDPHDDEGTASGSTFVHTCPGSPERRSGEAAPTREARTRHYGRRGMTSDDPPPPHAEGCEPCRKSSGEAAPVDGLRLLHDIFRAFDKSNNVPMFLASTIRAAREEANDGR